MYHEKKSWRDARKTCQAVNGDLVINVDRKKLKVIEEERKKYTPAKVWIGLNDRKSEGGFRWLDEPRTANNIILDYRAPHLNNKIEDCVVLLVSKFAQAKWDDALCGDRYKFFCEIFPGK
ncbi:hypothetical protein RRG08_048722 [Elysia crispata]|uniref:C-type lectin domain-containing protein n=1 Tax=Elysia crispata TaxID=231223 RepID=A0AAE1B7Y5_9GAST|nr:hypothetical protein RRG08_048722 [Elysia crispata]